MSISSVFFKGGKTLGHKEISWGFVALST